MKVSVITPTYSRESHLPALYHAFSRQTHSDIELLVLDDSPQPSRFMGGLDDPRVRYFYSPQRLSLGDKRNRLAAEAAGEIIACFDDDDYYAPPYIQSMAAMLGESDIVKLGAWFALSTAHGAFFYWDTAENHSHHWCVASDMPLRPVPSTLFPEDSIGKNLDGFGFSLVFRRETLAHTRFPVTGLGEDYAFVASARREGKRVVHVEDETGLAIAIQHGGNNSRIFPQYQLPISVAHDMFPELRDYLKLVPCGPAPTPELSDTRG